MELWKLLYFGPLSARLCSLNIARRFFPAFGYNGIPPWFVTCSSTRIENFFRRTADTTQNLLTLGLREPRGGRSNDGICFSFWSAYAARLLLLFIRMAFFNIYIKSTLEVEYVCGML